MHTHKVQIETANCDRTVVVKARIPLDDTVETQPGTEVCVRSIIGYSVLFPGVEEVTESSRYGLRFTVGALFTAYEVACELAAVLRKYRLDVEVKEP